MLETKLDKLTIKLCKNLPLDLTLYCKDGFCKKPNEDCYYCRKNNKGFSFCYKKTYTLNYDLKII
jgi:hypothetical protein